MASRPHHMNDGGVAERRLRPIYDWLDIGNNKKALQEAEKVLKKSPSLQSARALKALALFRLGRTSEARVVLDTLAEEKPSDDTTLQAMTISYKETHQLLKICSIYEAAVKAEPKSEELYSHLFMSYVRVGDYASQKRAAMALYKIAPKNPYYFWAVMSIVLQAKATKNPTEKNILLALARKMVQNFITENKMEAEQEARLYILILELQENWEVILNFLESHLYSQLVPGALAQTSIKYLKKLGHWKRLNVICKELLWENQDRWDYYMPYFDSVFHLMKENMSDGEANLDNSAEKCHEFICQLVESMSEGRTIRGPYLARLELWKRLSKEGGDTSLLGSGVALLVQYLRVFAHKPSAIPDLRPYLEMIPQKEREEHSRQFLTCLGLDENSEPSTMDDIQRHISCLVLWRITAPPLSSSENLELATNLRKLYLSSLQRGLHTSTVTEFCATDGYAVLAAHHYFYAAMQDSSTQPLVEAACLLELALHKSPANFHIKLLLIVLYHMLGNPLSADTIFRVLEVKHIQLVSLGWLHAAPSAAAAPRRPATDAASAHKQHSHDSVEHVTFAYKHGTFEKLFELYSWWSRVLACAWSALVLRQNMLRSLPCGGNVWQDYKELTHSFSDNRDINVIVNYDPPQFIDPDLKAKSFDHELAYLRLLDSLVSNIMLCVELGDNRSANEKQPQYEVLKMKIEAFSNAMEKYKDAYSEKMRISISFPYQPRIIAFVNSPVPYRELYTTLFNLVAELSIGKVIETHALCEQTAKLIEDSRPKVEDECGVAKMPRERLEALGNYVEFIGIITYIMGICSELVTPTTTKKSKKKISQSPDDLRTIELFNKLNDTIHDCVTFVEEAYDKLPTVPFDSNLETQFSQLHLDISFKCPVEQKLNNGHIDMINDVKNNIRKKYEAFKKCKVVNKLAGADYKVFFDHEPI